MKLLEQYHSGDQFLFQDESIRDEACRILTREHFVVRYFEDGSDYGLYIIVREEAESMLEIPAANSASAEQPLRVSGAAIPL